MKFEQIKSNKYFAKIIAIFSQGLTLKEIILSALLGSVIGIMPVLGIITILVTFLALRSKLNIAVAVLFSYLVAPIQILLFFNFINLGEKVLNRKQSILTFDAVQLIFNKPIMHIIKELWIDIACGLVGWLIIAIPAIAILFSISKKRN